MLKYAAAFVFSTGVLVYFIAPVAEEPQPEPTAVAEKPAPKPAENVEDEYWGDNAVDENFTFGEPLKYNDGENENESEETAQDTEPAMSKSEPAPATSNTESVKSAASRTTSYKQQTVKNPKPGEPGSRENPIDMTPPGGRTPQK